MCFRSLSLNLIKKLVGRLAARKVLSVILTPQRALHGKDERILVSYIKRNIKRI